MLLLLVPYSDNRIIGAHVNLVNDAFLQNDVKCIKGTFDQFDCSIGIESRTSVLPAPCSITWARWTVFYASLFCLNAHPHVLTYQYFATLFFSERITMFLFKQSEQPIKCAYGLSTKGGLISCLLPRKSLFWSLSLSLVIVSSYSKYFIRQNVIQEKWPAQEPCMKYAGSNFLFMNHCLPFYLHRRIYFCWKWGCAHIHTYL